MDRRNVMAMQWDDDPVSLTSKAGWFTGVTISPRRLLLPEGEGFVGPVTCAISIPGTVYFPSPNLQAPSQGQHLLPRPKKQESGINTDLSVEVASYAVESPIFQIACKFRALLPIAPPYARSIITSEARLMDKKFFLAPLSTTF